MAVAELTAKLALVPLKRTAVAPVKVVPLIVTLVPTGPLVGVKLVIVGALAVTVKLLLLVAVPPGVVTLSGPLVAPLGTVAAIEVEEFTVKLLLVPLTRTAVAPVKAVPLIVTLVPTGPLAGVKPVIVGAFTTVTLTAAEVAVLPAASRAKAVRVCAPALAVVVSQETEDGAAVSSAPKLAPSSLNCTPTTPTLSVALAETVTVPVTVAPAAGAVMETAGEVVSGGAAVVKVKSTDVARLPAASRDFTR